MNEPTFEEALTKLEAVVLQLETGDIPLEEALRTFEEGIRLARICTTRLEDAEQRVRLLTQAADGADADVPFVVRNNGGADG